MFIFFFLVNNIWNMFFIFFSEQFSTMFLKISSNANISLDYDDMDCGIFAISRYKTKYSDEVSKIVFEDALAYEKYFSKIGPSSSDRYMKQNLPSSYYDEIVKNY